ncbi:hypothetical protein CIB93_30855 [Streptomyces sp. WZ.A104]|uniref:hypothetical protein n=1 Tax=Streptomyces sp. WZ.A104 TaxID=2023771 RepID=UPI000BBC8F17|nr:hypothetical protein [Streptomyces sp. WZ.A104]PCG82309.1 hypothetical protein CIB93_30855 [Streptomyces sp. WZ.A104]
MPERAILDWLGPDDRTEARIYSRWAPPTHQIPALADYVATLARPEQITLAGYRAWAHARAPHLITAVVPPSVPERPGHPDYRYTLRTHPFRVTVRGQREGAWADLASADSPGDLFAAAARILSEQALRIRSLAEALPLSPFAAYLGSPDSLEAAAIRHEANAAAAGWWPDEHDLPVASLDPTTQNR